MTWLAVGAFLKALLGRLGAFLKSLSFWQLVSLGLAGFALVQHFELAHSRAEAAKLTQQLTKVVTQLQNISTRRDTQKVVTRDNLKVVTKVVHDADEVAKKVETAPPAPNCKTNQAVLGADL